MGTDERTPARIAAYLYYYTLAAIAICVLALRFDLSRTPAGGGVQGGMVFLAVSWLGLPFLFFVAMAVKETIAERAEKPLLLLGGLTIPLLVVLVVESPFGVWIELIFVLTTSTVASRYFVRHRREHPRALRTTVGMVTGAAIGIVIGWFYGGGSMCFLTLLGFVVGAIAGGWLRNANTRGPSPNKQK